MRQFGFQLDGHELIEVKEGDTWSFGRHTVTFVAAPMVHWPEAMVTFDTTDGVLFSADAFGSFGALDGKLFADEVNFDRDWIDDARRYLPTSSENTVRTSSFCSKRPPVFWIRSAISVRCTVRSGDKISDTSSTSTITGAVTNPKKRAL